MPVAPAAHYHMGGIAVDENGRSSLPGLWACGEVTATGAHGANRLASNSLLEALVFGARVADDLRSAAPVSGRTPRGRLAGGVSSGHPATGDAELTAAVRRLVWEKVGLVRDEAGLTSAVAGLDRLAAAHPQASGEARNLLCVAGLLTAAALERRESRGGHFRADYPAPDPAWQRRLFLTAGPDGRAHFEPAEGPAPILATAGGRP
jgi:L-aspartate oxidase